MLVLILTACSLAFPDDCREVRLQIAEDMTPMACAMQAQPTLAQWVDDHPGQRVERWRCGYPDREGQGT